MPTIPRRSVVHLASELAPVPFPERVTIALAALAETASEGLLALSVGLGWLWSLRSSRMSSPSWLARAANTAGSGRLTDTARSGVS